MFASPGCLYARYAHVYRLNDEIAATLHLEWQIILCFSFFRNPLPSRIAICLFKELIFFRQPRCPEFALVAKRMFTLPRRRWLWANRSTRCASLAVNKKHYRHVFLISPKIPFLCVVLTVILFCCVWHVQQQRQCSQLQKDVGQHERDRARRRALLQVLLRQEIWTQRLRLRRRWSWSPIHGRRNRIHCTNIYIVSFIFSQLSLKPFLGFIFLFHESWDVSTRKYDESRMRTLDRTDLQHRISRNWHKLT